MALDATRLGTALENAIRSSQGLDATPYPQLSAFANALASAIVTEITDNATLRVDSFTGDTTLTSVAATPSSHEHLIENLEIVGGIS